MDRILGQQRAIDLLNRQLASGRRHHAYVFHGPAGVGKFTTALAYASVLLCHGPTPDLAGRFSACGVCDACRLLRGLTPDYADQAANADHDPQGMSSPHPDLHVIRKELARFSDDKKIRDQKQRFIPVQVLRTALIDPANLAPTMGHGKVFIIDEAELMNAAGQNAILKTLEEPPAGTTLILVTSNEDRLLATIRSRCMRIAFTPLPDEAVEAWCESHAPELSAADRHALTRFAAGSPGRAQLVKRFGLLAWSSHVLTALDRAAQGKPTPTLGRDVHGFIEAFAKAWVKAHANASKEAANRLGADLIGSLIANHARRRIAELSDRCNPDDPIASEALLLPWLEVIDVTERTRYLLASNVNLSVACDYLAVSVMHALTTPACDAPAPRLA